MFKWKEEYCVNIDTIDRQHQQLFKLGNDIYNLLILDDGFDHYDEIMNILGELYNYTSYHFNYEEELLKNLEYDSWDLKIHKAEHKGFLNKILKISEEQVDTEQRKVTLQLMEFIANWIEQHVLNTDKQYEDFLKIKGIK